MLPVSRCKPVSSLNRMWRGRLNTDCKWRSRRKWKSNGSLFTCSKGEDGVKGARRGNRKKEESMRVSIPFLFEKEIDPLFVFLFISLVSIFNERRFMTKTFRLFLSSSLMRNSFRWKENLIYLGEANLRRWKLILEKWKVEDRIFPLSRLIRLTVIDRVIVLKRVSSKWIKPTVCHFAPLSVNRVSVEISLETLRNSVPGKFLRATILQSLLLARRCALRTLRYYINRY